MDQKELSTRAYQAFTLLARRVNWLMRQQLADCPITVQQCYTLEALLNEPKSMTELSSDVALHQSTLTRIVEKLEKQGMVNRMRKPENQRKVEVQITEHGKETYGQLYDGSMQTISALLHQIPEEQRETVVAAMETFLSVTLQRNLYEI